MGKDLLTSERIEKLQKYLIEHPINHEYDALCEALDSPAPPSQLAARDAYDILKEIDKLPPGIT